LMPEVKLPVFKRIPNHIGVIPDGNRRWAVGKGMTKDRGYEFGIGPGLQLYYLLLRTIPNARQSKNMPFRKRVWMQSGGWQIWMLH